MASEKQCVNPSVHPQPCQVCGPVGTSDKVSEAQNRRENILDDTLDYDDRAYWLDEHVAAVRAEQPAAVGNAKRILDKCEQYWNESHIHAAEVHAILEFIHKEARTLAQPPAIGHVARCHCLEVALGCDPRTDPRCKPGLLREAEVRLEVLTRLRSGIPVIKYGCAVKVPKGPMPSGDEMNLSESWGNEIERKILAEIDGAIDEARAEVERLRGQS